MASITPSLLQVPQRFPAVPREAPPLGLSHLVPQTPAWFLPFLLPPQSQSLPFSPWTPLTWLPLLYSLHTISFPYHLYLTSSGSSILRWRIFRDPCTPHTRLGHPTSSPGPSRTPCDFLPVTKSFLTEHDPTKAESMEFLTSSPRK